MNTDVVLDFIRVQSYEWEESCGEATIKQPLMDTDIHDKHILIVEDILDTGVTLKHLSMYLRLHQPLSVKTAVLLDKPARRVVEIKADYTGFEIENKFVYGYGLDYNQKYRNLPDIRTME
jgi:hypoxanthine phosphoribosyltransferase